MRPIIALASGALGFIALTAAIVDHNWLSGLVALICAMVFMLFMDW